MNPIRMGSLAVYGKAGCHSLASPVLHRHCTGRTTRPNGRLRPPVSGAVTKAYGTGPLTKSGIAWSVPYHVDQTHSGQTGRHAE